MPRRPSRGDVEAWVIWDPIFAQAEHRLKVRTIATTKDIVNGNSVYVANPDFATKYPKVLAAVSDEVTKLTEWAAQNREKFAETTSAAIGIDLDVERTAIGRTELIVGPVTPAISAQLQQTAGAFRKIRVISKPIVVRDNQGDWRNWTGLLNGSRVG
jgi:sulfonate transport system substrate-binding protein